MKLPSLRRVYISVAMGPLVLLESRKLSDDEEKCSMLFPSLNESVKIEFRRIILTLNSYSFSFLFPLTVAWVTSVR